MHVSQNESNATDNMYNVMLNDINVILSSITNIDIPSTYTSMSLVGLGIYKHKHDYLYNAE